MFQLLDYYDELHFTARPDTHIHLRCECISPLIDATVLSGSDNLICRAARSLQAQYNVQQGVDIVLYKRIPVGGGLGGGSANAAATLLALSRLWGLDCALSVLIAIGLQLGADVPVFLQGKTAWGEGIGEILTPITLRKHWFLVIFPGVSVASAAIYHDPGLTRATSPITIQHFLQGITQIRNDCESVVKMRYPVVFAALDWLNSFSPARLTGTGACVFAQFDCPSQAQAVLEKIPSPWQGFVSQGVNQFTVL